MTFPLSFNTKLSDNYADIFSDLNDIEAQIHTQECNCHGKQEKIDDCPHILSNAKLKQMYTEMPAKVTFIEKHAPSIAPQVKKHIFNKIIEEFRNTECDCQHKCVIQQQETINNDENSDLLKTPVVQDPVFDISKECHFLNQIRNNFHAEFEEYNYPVYQAKTKCKITNVMIAISFYSAFFLLAVKIIAFVISKSQSVLASVIDSFADILCGIILFTAVNIARKGIQHGGYQDIIFAPIEKKIKFMFSGRFESLGVLAFSAIMGTMAIILFLQSVGKIVGYAKGGESEVTFELVPSLIIGLTVLLKICLTIICHIVAKKYPNDQREAMITYRDDHRNDGITNAVAFIGAALSYYLQGGWIYCDPVASIILCCYILWNWGSKAAEQMRLLAGVNIDQSVMREYIAALLAIAGKENITAVWGYGYKAGPQDTLEFRIQVSKDTTVEEASKICKEINEFFENLETVNRCYCHLDTTSDKLE